MPRDCRPDIVSPHVRRHPQDNPQRHPHRPLFSGGILPCRFDPRPRVRPIQIVCSHVDYLHENADEVTSSQQWRTELSQLREECEAVPEPIGTRRELGSTMSAFDRLADSSRTSSEVRLVLPEADICSAANSQSI
jgi:hypothetical protein